MLTLPFAFGTRFPKLLFNININVNPNQKSSLSLSSPMATQSQSQPAPSHHQNVVVLRHGDRLDNFDGKWIDRAARPWDPPLHESGVARAVRRGETLREDAGFPIHRILVSPFLRCVQTAAGAISGLRADDETEGSRIKVSIEYGLCEMLNHIAIRPRVAPKSWELDFDVAQLEALFPVGTVDHSVEPVYKELPKRPEEVGETRSRYVRVFKALADKFPNENLLLITHGEGLGVAMEFKEEKAEVYDAEYCAYVALKRAVFEGEECSGCTGFGEFKVEKHEGVLFMNSFE